MDKVDVNTKVFSYFGAFMYSVGYCVALDKSFVFFATLFTFQIFILFVVFYLFDLYVDFKSK